MHIVQVEDAKEKMHVEVPVSGESLMLKIVLLKPQKEVQEPSQSRNLLRTVCKAKGNYCKLIIDNGSTDNLVSTKL